MSEHSLIDELAELLDSLEAGHEDAAPMPPLLPAPLAGSPLGVAVQAPALQATGRRSVRSPSSGGRKQSGPCGIG